MFDFGFKKKKNEGFGYISPERQRKQAIVNLIVEIIVVVILIVITLAALSYFGIIDTSKIGGVLNGQKDSLLPSVNPTNSPSLLQGSADLEVVSDIPGLHVNLKDKDGLVNLFRNWGIYGKIYFSDNDGTTNKKPLENIVVHLTDKPQKLLPYYDDDKDLVFTSSVKMSEKKFDIFIYVHPKVHKNKKLLGEYFQMSLVGTLYQRSHSLSTGNKLGQQIRVLDEILLEYKNNQYIEVIEGT